MSNAGHMVLPEFLTTAVSVAYSILVWPEISHLAYTQTGLLYISTISAV